jgi:hypothetical protein
MGDPSEVSDMKAERLGQASVCSRSRSVPGRRELSHRCEGLFTQSQEDNFM